MFDFRGQIIAITLLSLSAAESAIGLSLIVTSHKKLNTTDCNKFNNVKY
jgi:NADH:ubiquinone oxidoreductase subunit K